MYKLLILLEIPYKKVLLEMTYFLKLTFTTTDNHYLGIQNMQKKCF